MFDCVLDTPLQFKPFVPRFQYGISSRRGLHNWIKLLTILGLGTRGLMNYFSSCESILEQHSHNTETTQLTFIVNQMNGFYIMGTVILHWFKINKKKIAS